MSAPTEDQVLHHGEFRLYNAESSHRAGYVVSFQLAEERDYETFKALRKRKKSKGGIILKLYLLQPQGSYSRELLVDFVGYNVSATNGAIVRFLLDGEDDFAFFRALPAISNDENATVWDAVVTEQDDDGETIDQKQRERVETLRGGPVSQHAGRLCADREFQQWVGQRKGLERRATSDECAAFIREKCHVASRRELDHNEAAKERYHKWITRPFAIATTPR